MDKVEKIRIEIERLLKEEIEWMDKQGFTDLHIGKRTAYKNILDFIGSLQDDPKFKIGDIIRPTDRCFGSSRTIIEVCESWYVTDKGILDFEFEDNWEINNMEPEELSRAYRDFREECGIKDPIILDEIEEAYYLGMQQAMKNEQNQNIT